MCMIITPRLLPGVRIGDCFISVCPTSATDQRGAAYWRYYLDGPSFEYSGEDIAGWGESRDMLASLLSFLYAAAEASEYERRSGKVSENADLFPPDVVEWACANMDEISIISFELED